jgi:hypothetical protein
MMLLAAAELQGVTRQVSISGVDPDRLSIRRTGRSWLGEGACTAQKMITMTTDHSRGLR